MKKAIFSVIGVIIGGFIGFIGYLSVAINDTDVFYYKSAKLCSDLIKPVMKSPASYSYHKFGVLYREKPQTDLMEKVKGKDYLRDWFDDGRLRLIGYSTIVNYSSKNGYGVDLEGVASCDYDALMFDDRDPFSTDMVAVNLGGKQYKDEALLINFYSPLEVINLNKIGIKDKFDYFMGKSEFSRRKF